MAKAAGDYMLVRVAKGGHCISKVCPICATEANPNAAECPTCGRDY
jgi:hypothetical protein